MAYSICISGMYIVLFFGEEKKERLTVFLSGVELKLQIMGELNVFPF